MEERTDGDGRPASGVGRLILAWAGGIAALGFVAIVLLYLFGDPRPNAVDTAQVGGGPSAIPTVVAGEDYYRVRAEFIPLPPASETADPIGQAWAALFGESVARAGGADVRVVFEQADSGAQLSGGEDKLLLTAPADGPAKSAVTPFFARRQPTVARLRLDVIRRPSGHGGLLSALHAAFGAGDLQSSGWISVFPGAASSGGALSPATALQPVRDFTGHVIAAVRIGVEARRSIVFGEDFVPASPHNPALERLLTANPTPEALQAAVQSLLDHNLPSGFRDSAYKKTLAAQVDAMFADTGAPDAAAACRTAFGRLSGDLGLSGTDAALLAYLAWPGHRDAEPAGPACDDPRLQKTLAAIGAPAAAAAVAAASAREAAQQKAEAAAAKAKAVGGPEGRYVCLGASGGRIKVLCGVLNDLAAEWRSRVKFLNMATSRRYILDSVGIEEPTLDMTYAAGDIQNRRQLLIHIALSRVENFACFRLVHRNPVYFEALLVVRDGSAKAAARLDVFQFAFDDADKVVRIRRRAAVSQDLDEAKSLPETSRCRREFLGAREAELRKLIQQHWRLRASAG